MVKDCLLPKPPAIPISWAGKFYQTVAGEADAIFGMQAPLLTKDQLTVAEHEYTEAKGSWESGLSLAIEKFKKSLEEGTTL